MTFEITSSGVPTQTFDEIFQQLSDEYRSIYGNDINLDQESPDGQRVGIEARRTLDMQSFAVALFNSLDPDLADGAAFNRLLKFSGLYLGLPKRSQVDVTIEMDTPKTIPSGYTIKDDLGQTWSTQLDSPVVVGPNTITVFANDFGPIVAAPNTLTEPVTIELGVVSVTNPTAATPGSDEETIVEARQRRNRSLENPAQSNRGSIYARLAQVTGVTGLEVYENFENTTQNTIPPNHIWVVIEGGDVEKIAEIIAKNRHDGTGMKGSQTQQYFETVTRPDGSTFQMVHDVKFDRPTDVPLTIVVDAAKLNPTDVINVASIKAEIALKSYRIGEKAIASELYGFGYKAGENFVLTNLTINDGSGATSSELSTTLDGKFSIDVTNITVNLI